MRQPNLLRNLVNRKTLGDNQNDILNPPPQTERDDYLADILNVLNDISTDLRAVLNHLETQEE